MCKDKQYYINIYNKGLEEDRQHYIGEYGNDFDFDPNQFIETIEEIVGYYLIYYKDEALKIWLENLVCVKQKNVTDGEVTTILKTI